MEKKILKIFLSPNEKNKKGKKTKIEKNFLNKGNGK